VILVDPGMAAARSELDKILILQDPQSYMNREALWNSNAWDIEKQVQRTEHENWAYHDGCPTMAPLSFLQISLGAQDQIEKFQTQRDLTCPLEELIFYWTKVAPDDLIRKTYNESSNSAYYLLKHIAQHWINQLELINCTVAKGEYFSDDYQAMIDDKLSGPQWKAELIEINNIAKDINYMRRQMNHFWRAMVLNLERLGIQLGYEKVNNSLPLALRGAQMDFLTINSRMYPLRKRVDALTTIANDLSNLRAAFKGAQDGELSIRLSLLASIVFPLTLVASMLSMGDDFTPGKNRFWIFWAGSVPSVVIFAIGLVYGTRPYRIVLDFKVLIKSYCDRIKAERGKRRIADKMSEA
jgi:hypothetical protein